MRFIISLILATTLLVGCCGKKVVPLPTREVSYYVAEEVAYELERMVAEYNFMNFDIHLCHSKAYKTWDGQLRIWVDMYSQELLEVRDARHLMANMVAAIVEGVNRHFFIRAEDGGEAEISVKNLYISVEFESFFGRFVDPLYVGRMELINGYLTAYYAHTALDRDSIIFHQFFEPYVTTAMLTRVDHQVLSEMDEYRSKQDLGEFLESAEKFHRSTIHKKPSPPPPPFHNDQFDDKE